MLTSHEYSSNFGCCNVILRWIFPTFHRIPVGFLAGNVQHIAIDSLYQATRVAFKQWNCKKCMPVASSKPIFSCKYSITYSTISTTKIHHISSYKLIFVHRFQGFLSEKKATGVFRIPRFLIIYSLTIKHVIHQHLFWLNKKGADLNWKCASDTHPMGLSFNMKTFERFGDHVDRLEEHRRL